ncbi:phosphatase PAP2 family protein [Streptomyces sp. NPDC001678]|uniref:phosphatase PAP2 family protein n=1 Tax=Streptomyces sp. NPDC001678 TaxID=3364599 RepID=UPI00368CF266
MLAPPSALPATPVPAASAPSGPSLAFDGSTIDGGWYTDVTQLARHSARLLNDVMSAWSSYGLALFALLMLVVWWRARRADAATMARALAVPVVVVLVYGVDMVLKSVVREVRPCRSIPHSFTLESCPAPSDWAFPSNHTVIAFSAATALWLLDRKLGALAFLAAVAMGFSRIWVGAHYPHDVAAGALVGVLVALPLAAASERAAPWVERARNGRLRPLLAAD